MSRTYKTTGVNLKSMPLGESDRLLTILTQEFGLIRVVAPGSRKPNSKMVGRSGLFVVNELLISSGRSLDKILQAETLESYPGLSKDLARLTASQYLAELVLIQALSEQSQVDLFWLFCEHLSRLERSPQAKVLAYLAQGIFHLLAWFGIAPQVQICCNTQQSIVPDLTNPNWRVEFNAAAGGILGLPADGAAAPISIQPRQQRVAEALNLPSHRTLDNETKPPIGSSMRLNAIELSLLQQLAQPNLCSGSPLPEIELDQQLAAAAALPQPAWLAVERALRLYAQYHFDRPIRSAALIDTCFFALTRAS